MPRPRPLSLLIAIGLAASTLVLAPSSAAACGSGTYSGGDGTSSNPYQISSAADLVTLRDTTADFGCYFIQTASIDLSAVAQWSTGIGISGTAFSGNFDGNGKTISNLNVVRNSGTVSGLGLFGWLEGTVEDVTVSGTVSNNQHFVGGLVGHAGPGARVSSSSASVAVTGTYAVGGLIGYAPAGAGTVIEDSSASGNVTATATTANSYAGGLAGHIQTSTEIRRSYATGDVNGQAQWIGGLVGRAQSATIEQTFATGSVTNTQAGGAASTGGLVGEAERTPISDSFATGLVQAGASAAYVGGLVGLLNQSTGQVTRSYSIGRVSGGSSSLTGGLVGEIFNSGTVSASMWNTETSGKATSDGGAGVKGKSTAELLQLITYTDATAGFDWNAVVAQTIAEGYDANYTWGICSAVNDGYPFLTAFYTSDPCSGGGDGPVTTSPQPTYTFSFLTSGGGTCLPTVTVQRFERYTLPPASVACTPLGTSMVGWSIPGQAWAFAPGRVVTVVDSQVFTAMAREPEITIFYDANVNMTDPCIANDTNVENETDRHETVQTPRTGTETTLATSAPCAPPGFELIGWTDANTPDGSGQAQSGAQTYERGAAIPDAWNIDDPNPVNRVRLYALWGRSAS